MSYEKLLIMTEIINVCKTVIGEEIFKKRKKERERENERESERE